MNRRDKMLANPFVIGRYAGDYYFCDRVEETDFLLHSVKNGRDIAIISPRRLGKSGLIEHVFASEEVKGNYITIFIDIYATSSVTELVAMLGQAVFRAVVKESETAWRRFVNSLRSLRPAISFDTISGEPSLSLTAVSVDHPELTLAEIFEYLETAPKKCIVAIDEFQQIATYDNDKAEALLRTHIQRTPNTRFIFAGSAQSMMETMFNSPRKPFYQSCITMGLNPIPLDEYISFAMKRFEDYGKKGDERIIKDVYNRMRGTTWFVQMMLNELFALTPESGTLREDDISKAERNIIGIQEYSYREIMARLSPRQRDLAYYIASRWEVENLLSASSLKESGFKTAASMQAALKGLEKAALTTKSGSKVRLYDTFFSSWLRKQ